MLYSTRQYFSYLRKARNEYSLHSPFMFDLYNAVFKKTRKKNTLFTPVEQLRQQLLGDKTIMTVRDLGAGSHKSSSPQRRVCDITRHTSKSPRQARFLAELAAYLGARTVIELGTSMGISTAYLARGNTGATIYTIEGDAGIAQKANAHFQRLGLFNVQGLQGNFDETLPGLLAELRSFDLLFIDGNHTHAATQRYFELALAYRHNGSVMVFDDIYWSEDMTRAWKEIIAHPAVTASVDTYTFGIVFFRKELSKQHFILRL